MYAKNVKVTFPTLTRKDKFILYMYSKYLGYKLILGVFDGKRKAIVLTTEGKPGFIQKVEEKLMVVYKDGVDTINPTMIMQRMEKRLRTNFLLEVVKAEQYAAGCKL